MTKQTAARVAAKPLPSPAAAPVSDFYDSMMTWREKYKREMAELNLAEAFEGARDCALGREFTWD